MSDYHDARRPIAEEIQKQIDSNLNPTDLLKQANKLRQVMHENKLHYYQAERWLNAWMKPGVHKWFLLGLELANDGRLSVELFFEIATYLTGLSRSNTVELFKHHQKIMPEKLKIVAMNAAEKKYAPTFISSLFSSEKALNVNKQRLNAAIKSAQERCENRKMKYSF